MFAAFVLVILALAALAGFFLLHSKLIGLGALVAFVLLAGWTMTTIVSPTDVGVPISFGSIGQPMNPGLNTKAPWTDVETYPTRPFQADDQAVSARTNQSGNVTYTVGARWYVDKERAADTYRQIRSGDEEVINKTIVDRNVATAVTNVVALLDNQGAVGGDPKPIEKSLLDEANRLVGKYGVTIESVPLRKRDPDPKTAESIARLAAQQQATKVAAESVNTAEQTAKAREKEALGLKQAAGSVGAVTPEQAYALCVQAWERMQHEANTEGRTLYAQPCGGGSQPVVTAK